MADENAFTAAQIAPRKAVIDEHWCMHTGCERWGRFGYRMRYGTLWFCGDHRSEGEAARRPDFPR